MTPALTKFTPFASWLARSAAWPFPFAATVVHALHAFHHKHKLHHVAHIHARGSTATTGCAIDSWSRSGRGCPTAGIPTCTLTLLIPFASKSALAVRFHVAR